ncbi:MAG: hypothetical protein HON29_01235 [Candidatus Magasanikbacteria bacterium]|nr:hypothetical protein [Candidatus Magasanikbacteria bacterium]
MKKLNFLKSLKTPTQAKMTSVQVQVNPTYVSIGVQTENTLGGRRGRPSLQVDLQSPAKVPCAAAKGAAARSSVELKRINSLYKEGARIKYLKCCGEGVWNAPNGQIRRAVTIARQMEGLPPPNKHECVCDKRQWTSHIQVGRYIDQVEATPPTSADKELGELLITLRYESQHAVRLNPNTLQYEVGGTRGTPPPFGKRL